MMRRTMIVVGILVILCELSAAASASSTTHGCNFDEESKVLECRLRTLQSGLHGEESVCETTSRANAIRILCSEDEDDLATAGFSFSESVLRPSHFGSLPFLEELRVEGCRINRVPARAFVGLSGLRRLVLSGRTSGWSAAALEVERGALEGLGALEELDLSDNSLWALPRGALCGLAKLRSANFSRNHLTQIADLGLAAASVEEGCQEHPELVSLDLSRNAIGSLGAGDLGRASASLRRLLLSHNRVSILGDDALASLGSLQELDLSDNQLSALPPALFSSQQAQLRRLHLHNNSLSLLPAGTFEGLANLEALNLSMNALSSHLISGDTFHGLSGLQVLDLSHNVLTSVDSATFRQLPQLQVLVLSHNQLRSVSELSFRKSLRVLSLSHNRMESLPEAAFEGQMQLESLSLDNNLLSELNLLPQSVSTLVDLALNGNLLRSVPAFVRQARRLRTLDLGANKIEQVSPSDLEGLSDLYGLRLEANLLTEIRNDTFSECCSSRLHILNLANNRLDSIEVGSFHGLLELRTLLLDGNKLEDLNGLVSSLGKLRWLNVSSNSLQWFDYAFVPSSLEWLDMSNNQVCT